MNNENIRPDGFKKDRLEPDERDFRINKMRERIKELEAIVVGQQKEFAILNEKLDKNIRHSAEVEPLAVLADRKGYSLVVRRDTKGMGLSIFNEQPNEFCQMRFDRPTYAAAEKAAREWLNKLEDK